MEDARRGGEGMVKEKGGEEQANGRAIPVTAETKRNETKSKTETAQTKPYLSHTHTRLHQPTLETKKISINDRNIDDT